MPNKQKKSTAASGKLKLTKQTIKDLRLKGDKAGGLKGGAGSGGCKLGVASTGECANKIAASGGCLTIV